MIKKYFYALIKVILTNVRFLFYKIIHPTTFKYSPILLVHPLIALDINRGAKVNFGRLMRAGSNCTIKSRKGSILTIGRNVGINSDCHIVCHEKIEIGENTILAPNVMLFDHDHDFRVPGGIRAAKYKTSPIIIGKNVWIAAGTIILRGTTIGDNSVVGAGCVVKGTFPTNSVIVQKRENVITTYKN